MNQSDGPPPEIFGHGKPCPPGADVCWEANVHGERRAIDSIIQMRDINLI